LGRVAKTEKFRGKGTSWLEHEAIVPGELYVDRNRRIKVTRDHLG